MPLKLISKAQKLLHKKESSNKSSKCMVSHLVNLSFLNSFKCKKPIVQENSRETEEDMPKEATLSIEMEQPEHKREKHKEKGLSCTKVEAPRSAQRIRGESMREERRIANEYFQALQKLKEIYLVEIRNQEQETDMEEVMFLYSQLTNTLYAELMNRFIMEISKELLQV